MISPTKKTFVVWVWNGEKSRTFSTEWIEAVMFSKRAALDVVKRLLAKENASRSRPKNIYSVFEWQGEKLIAMYDQDGYPQ